MTAKKRPAKKATKKAPRAAKKAAVDKTPDVDLADEEFDFVPDAEVTLPTTIETRVVVEAIEAQPDDDRHRESTMYRVVFHADLPEHVMQHLFSHHVQDGGINVEFQPADMKLKRKDTLVRR